MPCAGTNPLTWLSIGQIHSDADAKQMLRAAAPLLAQSPYLVLTSNIRDVYHPGLNGAASTYFETVYEYARCALETDPFPQELWYNSEYRLNAGLSYKTKDLRDPAEI